MMMDWSDVLALLADAALRVTLILTLAFTAAGLLRRSSARVRHGIWAVSLVGALLVPLLSVTLPGWSVPLLPALPAPGGDGGAAFTLPLTSGSAHTVSADLPAAEPYGSLMAGLDDESGHAVGHAGWWSPRKVAVGLLAVWLLGMTLVAVRLAHGLGCLRRWTRAAVEEAGPVTGGVLEHLLPDLGLRRPVRVLRSEHLTAPITWGWLRPVALLPATSDDWSPERRRIVLLHELIHVRHGDWLVQVAAQLACALYWFHPLVWLAVRRLQAEREQACDESVLDRGTRPSEYATHLLEIAKAMAPGTHGPALGLSMAQRGQLERRLLTMLNRRRPVHRTFLPVAGAILLMSALVVSVSAVKPRPAAVPVAPAPPAVPAPVAPPDSSAVLAAVPAPDAVPSAAAAPALAALAPVAPPDSSAVLAAVPAPDAMPSAAAAPAPPAPVDSMPVPAAMPAPLAAPSLATPAVPMAPAAVASSFSGTIQHGDGSYFRVGHEGGTFVLEKTDDDFKLRLHIEHPDTVEFSRDGSEIVRMGRRASVLLRTSTDDAWQRLEILPDSDGDLRHDWTVNGEQRNFDDQAREWMSLALQVVHGIREASELRGKQSSLRGQISSIRGQRSSLHGQISSARGRESSLRGEISSIKGHVSSQRGQTSSIRGRVSSLRGQMSGIRGHESSLRGQISNLRGRISSLKAQRRGTSSNDEEMNRLAGEMNQRLDDQIEEFKVQIREVEREIETYDAEVRIREVEREIEEYNAEVRIREVEREIEKLNADERADEIEGRTRPLYDDLRRMSRRLD